MKQKHRNISETAKSIAIEAILVNGESLQEASCKSRLSQKDIKEVVLDHVKKCNGENIKVNYIPNFVSRTLVNEQYLRNEKDFAARYEREKWEDDMRKKEYMDIAEKVIDAIIRKERLQNKKILLTRQRQQGLMSDS